MRIITARFILFGLLLAVSLQMQSCGGGRKDADIQTEIASLAQSNPALASVTATVVDGDVILTGQCKDEDCRKDAEKAIKKIDGVDDVTNNITITPNMTIISDDELRENAKRIISKYKNVEAGISNGIITLRGKVDKDKLQQLVTDLSSLRPRRIDNQLIVE